MARIFPTPVYRYINIDGKSYRIIPKHRVINRFNSFMFGLFIGAIACGVVAFMDAKRIYHLNKVVTSMTEQLGKCEVMPEETK